MPKVTSENRAAIVDDALRDTMEANDVIQEDTSHQSCTLRVRQWNEVGVLGRPVNHQKNVQFAVDVWKAFNEIHQVVHPNLMWNCKRLKQAIRMKILHPVVLACSTATEPVAD